MKKAYSRILTLTLLLMINVFVFSGAISLNAKNHDELYQEISKTETTVLNDVVWTNIIANTKTTMPKGLVAGYGSSGEIDVNTWYGQQINMLSIPRVLDADGNQKYEIIEWSMQGDQQWDFRAITTMAQDFEKKNPDYIVLGGINGDFYDWHTTKDYPNSGNGIEIQNGEAIRVIRSGTHAVGVKNNNDLDQLVFVSNTLNHFSKNPYLTIYDNNGNVLKEIELNGINLESLNDGETSAYFPRLEIVYLYDEFGNHVLNSYDEWAIQERIFHAPTLAEGNSYYVINGDKVIYQADENSYYGKGIITNVNDDTEITKNSFAIVTKNQELLQLLNKEVEISVQYKVTDPHLAQTENAMGCGDMLIENGVFATYYSDSYYSTRAPRTIIGCKADGTVCLITMDGRQADKNYYGTNQEEINSVLYELGIDDAYLLDGGGSTTFFVRENDQFLIKNSPSDGQTRSVSNAFLIVTKKDNSVKLSGYERTTNSISFMLDKEAIAENITKCYVEINGVVTEFINGVATVENLESNTDYQYRLLYDTELYKNIPTTTINTVTTLKNTPLITLGEITQDDNYFYPTFTISDNDSAIQIIEVLLINKQNNKTIDDMMYDFDEPSTILKLKKSKSASDYKCVVRYYYRLGNGEKLEIIDLEYDLSVFDKPITETPETPSDQEEGGCKSGIVFISPIIAAGALLLLKWKKR